MDNINTQPQAFYTKIPSANVSGNTNMVGNVQTPKKKKSFKNIFAIVGIIFFIIVASTGVFIAQKQITQKGQEITPVAPNAPASKPSATVDNNNYCATSFTVPKGDADCISKVAQSDFSKNGTPTIYNEPGIFNIGDRFVFKITVTATEDTVGPVEVLDVLPKNLLFVEDPDNTPGLEVSNNYEGTNVQSVVLNIDSMSKDESIDVEFMVEAIIAPDQVDPDIEDLEVFSATNSARVVTNDDINSLSICKYEFSTLVGTAECTSKELYDGDPAESASEVVPAGSALTIGEEYVYYITVNATNKTNGEVKLYDVIPSNFKFVRALTASEKYISNVAGDNEIFVNFGILEDEEVTLGFVVKVIDQPTLGKFTNSALVYIYPTDSTTEEPLETGSICEVDHTILPNGTAQCTEKQAFTDFDGTEIKANETVKAGQEFIYRISIKANRTTTGDVVVVDQLPENLIFVEDADNTNGITYNSTTRRVTMDYGVIEDSDVRTIEFKVQVVANPTVESFINIATVTTDSDTSHVCKLPLKLFVAEVPDYACNEACETNANCQTVNEDYICYTAGDKKVCRLESNPSSSACYPAATPTPTPTPTPAPGCNEACVSNADCSNNSYVCITTADSSNRCRLETYPNSITCTVPLAQVQPELPPTLPQTGPEDWLNWLKAGLVTLGVGTALFLLL